MTIKEKLIKEIENVDLDFALRKKIFGYLNQNYDSMTINQRINALITNQLDQINDNSVLTDQDAIEILKILGVQTDYLEAQIYKTEESIPQEEIQVEQIETEPLSDAEQIEEQIVQTVEEVEPIQKTEINRTNVLYDKYNTMLITNQDLNKKILSQEKLIQQLKQELETEKSNKVKSVQLITSTMPLITAADNDINKLYIQYVMQGQMQNEDALILEQDNQIIIPKTYYRIIK